MNYQFTRVQIVCVQIAGVFILGMSAWSGILHHAHAQIIPPVPTSHLSLDMVILVPKVTIDARVVPDLSRVNWDQQIMVMGKKVALSSEEALRALLVSEDIRTLVRDYRTDKEFLDATIFILPSTRVAERAFLKHGLERAIAEKLVEQGEFPGNYFELEAQGFVQKGNTLLTAANAHVLNLKSINATEPHATLIGVTPVRGVGQVSFLERAHRAVRGVFQKIAAALAPQSAFADVSSVSEDAVSYLVNSQDENGSWGSATSTRFITTAAVLSALQAQGIAGTTTSKSVDRIMYYIPENNDYLAEQLGILSRAGISTSTAEALARGLSEDAGGFTFDRSYAPDPLTTAKAVQALFAAGYQDYGDNPHATEALAVHYLMNTKRFDNGWSVSEGGVSSIPVTSEVIEALAFWRHQSVGGTPVKDVLDPAVHALIDAQETDGTWGGDLLSTALAYRAIKVAGYVPTYEQKTLQYFENEQLANGSFDNDPYQTAQVLSALSVVSSSGKILITDIVPTSALQTGTTTTFNILMTNTGNTAVDSGVLHLVTDDYDFASFDLGAAGVVVQASSTVDLSVAITNTRNFQGDVVFKVFVEGAYGAIHPGSRYQETLAYASDPANRPALPTYFVAHKSVANGAPAITWRWPIKNDPKLKNVVLMWRPVGAPAWSGAYVTSTTTASSATVGGLTNDQAYEATLGTSDNAGSIYYFSGGHISQVKTSALHGSYVGGSVAGVVKALEGAVGSVDVLGVTASTTARTEVDGSFLQQHIPWGTGYARVSHFLYEKYVKKYATADTALTGVMVYTNRIVDTANPAITSLSIVGEPDKIMENKERELIRYSVDDDIKKDGLGVVARISFDYYDPRDRRWHNIGFVEGDISGTRTYAWDIPGTLLGPGYKIRAISTDFAGKVSAPRAWGTFELTPGNASPQVSFIAPGATLSPIARTSYTIKWTDTDEEDNAVIFFSYDPDKNKSNGNHTLVTSVQEDDEQDQYVWDVSLVPVGNFYVRADAFDGHNATTTMYSTTTVRVRR